jgi:hypothetical protein
MILAPMFAFHPKKKNAIAVLRQPIVLMQNQLELISPVKRIPGLEDAR